MTSQDIGPTLEEIKILLEGGNFDEFIDKMEGDFFEAKQQKPYVIDSTDNDKRFSARVELASDIASMANSKGGYIVCGLSTDPENTLQTDVVKGLKVFDQNSFYTEEVIQEVVDVHIEPDLKVTVTWYPSNSDSSLGIGSIYVPPQNESKKSFLVTAVEVNEKRQRHFIAIPIRQGSEPVWMSPKQIYRLAASKKPTELKEAFDELSGQISELRDLLVTGKGIQTPADDIQRKIKEVLDVH